MTAAREAIMTALFALVSAAGPFATASRRLQLWTELSAGETPAIFMAEREEQYDRKGEGLPPVVTMNVDLYIYTKPGLESGVTPSSVLNPLLDAIDAALAPSRVTGRLTLGGIVTHCRIEGKVFKDPGDIDGEGMAIIPIKILATI